jgi:glycosyltransferase involved in cell wall biosynthesis
MIRYLTWPFRWLLRRIFAAADYIGNHGLGAFAAEIVRNLTHADRIASALLVSTVARPEKVYKELAKVSDERLSELKVSVVIPVLNGIADGLEELLKSLTAQTHKNIEIVAVDSGSTDNSIELLERYGAKVTRIPKERFSHDYARNLGAEQATGTHLLFTVCDARFTDPRWIETGLRHLLRFNAVSYSTPQRYDHTAEPYARYLAYTFLAANKYALGTNIFGNRLLGRMAWKIGRPWFREKIIHVDDTNHLVDGSFFRSNRYTRPTCEDMAFGSQVIKSNRRFIYSTLSYIRHFHSYRNFGKYFDRVYVDLMVIQDILGRPYGASRPGLVDTTVSTATLILAYLLQTIARYESFGATSVALLESRRDLVDAAIARDTTVVRGVRILTDLDHRLRGIDGPSFVLEITQYESAALDLISSLKLRVSPVEAPRDLRRFVDFRDRFVMHLRVSVDILARKLGYNELSLGEFRDFALLCFINFLASELAKLMYQYQDQHSANVEVLQSLRWR